MISRQTAAFADKARQTFAYVRIYEDHSDGIIQENRVVFFDLRVFKIVQVVAEYRFIGAGLLPIC